MKLCPLLFSVSSFFFLCALFIIYQTKRAFKNYVVKLTRHIALVAKIPSFFLLLRKSDENYISETAKKKRYMKLIEQIQSFFTNWMKKEKKRESGVRNMVLSVHFCSLNAIMFVPGDAMFCFYSSCSWLFFYRFQLWYRLYPFLIKYTRQILKSFCCCYCC